MSDSHESLSASSLTERDEVREIEKVAQVETKRIRVLRLVFTVVLFTTAAIVTSYTYLALTDQQHENFEQAFTQFSGSLIASAKTGQERLDESIKSMSTHLTAYALRNNMTWPFVTDPDFEVVASTAAKSGSFEMNMMAPLVKENQVEEWQDYAETHCQQWMLSSHRQKYQNIQHLEPINYHRNITEAGPDGLQTTSRGKGWYSPIWQFSPPPVNYGIINYDMMNAIGRKGAVEDMIRLRNYSTTTLVSKYIARDIAFTQEQHEAMHSKLRDSSIEFPHTFQFGPIYETFEKDAPLVGMVEVAFSWDANMRNLLSEGTKPLTVILENNCKNAEGGKQLFTYTIDESDAIFIGNGDLHDSTYSRSASANLSLIPPKEDVECRYFMVRLPH